MTNKFENKEAARKSAVIPKSTAVEISTKKPKKSMMSMNVDPELYEKFKYVAKRAGGNATAVLTAYMYQYVKDHQDLL